MNKQFYITVSIPYVNSTPHIGYALECLQADVYNRYYKSLGYETYFLSGSDDNALKNVHAAQALDIPTKQFVDNNSSKFAKLKAKLNLTTDQFFQTSTDKHFKGSQKLWLNFKKEDLYQKQYRGYYCVGCEQFYNQDELLTDSICPIHKKTVDIVEEENWFFKLSNYQHILHDLIKTDKLQILPIHRKNEMLSFIEKGLEDFSISRSIERSKGWGVPVPNDPTQIMYVWVDALSNYITALGYAEEDNSLFKKFWPADIHLIGKDISRFHTIYWPAFLLSANIPLPKSVLIHGFITVEGEKMSKSIGNVLSPDQLIQPYGVEATRYYLLREIPTYSDGNYSEHRMLEIYNADLANSLGNLISRTISMLQKYTNSTVPPQPNLVLKEPSKDLITEAIRKVALNCVQNDPSNSNYSQFLKSRELSKALEHIWQNISELNQLINLTEPWKLAKQDNLDQLHSVLYWLSHGIHNIAWELYPFLPQTSQKIAHAFSIDELEQTDPNMFHGIHEWQPEAKINPIEILFPKINV